MIDAKVLVVDDDLDILTAAKLLLKRHVSQVLTCSDPNEIPQLMSREAFDVILLDMNFGPGESAGQQGFFWLENILNIAPDAIIIMITAHGGVNIAVEAMKLGATDFVSKPWQNEKMVATVKTAIKLKQSQVESSQLKNKNDALIRSIQADQSDTMIANAPSMQALQTMIERAAPTDANVLVLGENGTGKELVARAIHKQSLRQQQVFMSVDLGAVSESLFESELFGHKKGAFTGANENRMGRIQAAQGGTLFLDEIGNLPLHLQAKLLTVLEQRQVTPLGSDESISIDVRVIAATNVPKQDLANPDLFRQDLLFRLNTVELSLPPLRERKEDILTIAHHYLDVFKKKYHKPTLAISADAEVAITNDSWPGNIRALKHAIERAVILCSGNVLNVVDLQLSQHSTTDKEKPIQSPQEDASQELNLEKLEYHAITTALKKHRYNISKSAKELGLTRAALYRRMEKYDL